MTITELLASFVNHNLDREDALRALLAHRGWLVPLRAGSKRAIEANVANTMSAWIMSGDENYRAAVRSFPRRRSARSQALSTWTRSSPTSPTMFVTCPQGHISFRATREKGALLGT